MIHNSCLLMFIFKAANIVTFLILTMHNYIRKQKELKKYNSLISSLIIFDYCFTAVTVKPAFLNSLITPFSPGKCPAPTPKKVG